MHALPAARCRCRRSVRAPGGGIVGAMGGHRRQCDHGRERYLQVAVAVAEHSWPSCACVQILGRWMDVAREVARAPHGLEALAQVMRYILEVNEHVEPEELQKLLERDLGPEAKDAIMTAGQRLIEQGRQQGIQQGMEEGRQRFQVMLLRLLRQRFGNEVDTHVEQRIAAASVEQIEAWSARVLSAATLAEAIAD